MHAGLIERQREDRDRLAAGLRRRPDHAVDQEFERRNRAGGAVEVPILGAHRDFKGFAGPDDAGRKSVDAGWRLAHDDEAHQREVEPLARRVEIHVDRERHPLARDGREHDAAPAARTVAVGDRHRRAGIEFTRGQAKHQRRLRRAESAVRTGGHDRLDREARVGVGGGDGDVAFAPRIGRLVFAEVRPEVAGNPESAAAFHAARADRPDLAKRRIRVGFERAKRLGAQRAECLGLFFAHSKFANQLIHIPRRGGRPLTSRRRRREPADVGTLEPHLQTRERLCVDPVGEDPCAPRDGRCVRWLGGSLALELRDFVCEIGSAHHVQSEQGADHGQRQSDTREIPVHGLPH